MPGFTVWDEARSTPPDTPYFVPRQRLRLKPWASQVSPPLSSYLTGGLLISYRCANATPLVHEEPSSLARQLPSTFCLLTLLRVRGQS